MFASLALIKTFLSHWVGIVVVVIILAALGFGYFEHYENTKLEAQIASLNQDLGAQKTNTAQWTAAASECSSATAALATSEATATATASEAVAKANVKAQTYVAHGKAILARKPSSNDDYTASKDLMNQLIQDRQARLQGAQQ